MGFGMSPDRLMVSYYFWADERRMREALSQVMKVTEPLRKTKLAYKVNIHSSWRESLWPWDYAGLVSRTPKTAAC